MPERAPEPYVLPRHPGEVNRLDLQHYAFRAALHANHQAPVRDPARVLDVGAGTGQWGWEIAAEFPRALVVGLDLVAGKPGWPDRYQPVRANLLHGLPFAEGTFDFVHQRLLFLGIPVDSWPDVVRDFLRVTRPGGWVELVEGPIMRFGNAGPAIERLREVAVAVTGARGLDTSGAVYDSLDGYLRQAGATEVERKEVQLPVGEWGGMVGSFLGTDFRTGFTRFLEARSPLGAEERNELLQRVQDEYEERHVTAQLGIAFGRRAR
jgi:SAM-dependent methyltransferase